MNSQEPFEVRHYLSKTLQLFTKSTGSASAWFFSTIFLSLVGLFPTVGHTKKAVIPTPGLFIERNYAVSFNNLCKKYRETDLHFINKINRDTHTLKRKNKQPALLSHAARNTSRTHTHIHTKKNNEKLVLICPPSLHPQPLGPKLWTFPAGCLGERW